MRAAIIEILQENDIPNKVKLIWKSFTVSATTEERLLRQFADEHWAMYAFRAADKMSRSRMRTAIIEDNRALRFWHKASALIHIGPKFDFSTFGHMEKEL